MERLLGFLEVWYLASVSQNLGPLALEPIPSPVTGLLSLEHKGEGEAAPAPNSLHNPR